MLNREASNPAILGGSAVPPEPAIEQLSYIVYAAPDCGFVGTVLRQYPVPTAVILGSPASTLVLYN